MPIEANRTRGLSLRGPDGTAFSEGYGLLGSKASAWIIIENVGNAQENQIAISWDNTDWGSNLEIFNSQGNKENAIILGPGESKEMTVRLPVPNNVDYGEAEALTTYGIIGIKVWIYKGEVFAKEFSQETNKETPKEVKA